ncbi:TVP38/TMEM64 family protein [Metabacillus indicus]|uniref:TVP38/TMEM64 family protein n=1 Tax=Metabacillus indicus TaxID=246786 RepID=UPI0024923445|nr:TVP38/TMEM64 family protein [Metabacillus indicus]
MKKNSVWKLLVIAAGAGVLLWINSRYLNLQPKTIKDWMLSFGAAAPLLYIVLYSVRPLILFPASVMSLAGGLAFGPYLGTLYTLAGATIGAVVAYLAAGTFKLDMFRKPENQRMKTLKKQLEQNGFIYVLILRLIPIVHFDAISYAAGISKVRLLPFAAATFIGVIPGTFAFTFLGSSFAEGNVMLLAAAGAVFLLLMLLPLLFRKKVKQLITNESK